MPERKRYANNNNTVKDVTHKGPENTNNRKNPVRKNSTRQDDYRNRKFINSNLVSQSLANMEADEELFSKDVKKTERNNAEIRSHDQIVKLHKNSEKNISKSQRIRDSNNNSENSGSESIREEFKSKASSPSYRRESSKSGNSSSKETASIISFAPRIESGASNNSRSSSGARDKSKQSNPQSSPIADTARSGKDFENVAPHLNEPHSSNSTDIYSMPWRERSKETESGNKGMDGKRLTVPDMKSWRRLSESIVRPDQGRALKARYSSSLDLSSTQHLTDSYSNLSSRPINTENSGLQASSNNLTDSYSNLTSRPAYTHSVNKFSAQPSKNLAESSGNLISRKTNTLVQASKSKDSYSILAKAKIPYVVNRSEYAKGSSSILASTMPNPILGDQANARPPMAKTVSIKRDVSLERTQRAATIAQVSSVDRNQKIINDRQKLGLKTKLSTKPKLPLGKVASSKVAVPRFESRTNQGRVVPGDIRIFKSASQPALFNLSARQMVKVDCDHKKDHEEDCEDDYDREKRTRKDRVMNWLVELDRYSIEPPPTPHIEEEKPTQTDTAIHVIYESD